MIRFYALFLTGCVLAPLPRLTATSLSPGNKQPVGHSYPATSPRAKLPQLPGVARAVHHVLAPTGGTGQGNFVAPATNAEFAVGNNPFNVVLSDVDGDGDLDFLTANASDQGAVSVRLNDGKGNFAAPATNTEIPVGASPTSVAVGDVDGDGDPDFLTANSHSATVSVRLNDGRGNFSVPATNAESSVRFTALSVTLGDVDGDGDLDFLTANNDNTVSVRLNNGRGSFTAPATNADPQVGDYPYSVVLGDIDGDGDVDFLTANNHSATVSVRLNDGQGNFAVPATNAEPAIADYAWNIVLGDVDGDQDLDFLTANNNGTVSVRLNDGKGSFTAPATNADPAVAGRFPQSVALGDVDGDGDLDFLSANNNLGGGTVSVRLNDGRGNFSAPATNPNPSVGDIRPRSVGLGDLDGDGDLDLLTANLTFNGTVSVRLNQPALTLPVRAGASTQELTLFPNPTRGSMTVLGAPAGAVVEVVNALGQVVLRTSADATGNTRLVLPAGLASGRYLVRTGQQVVPVVLD